MIKKNMVREPSKATNAYGERKFRHKTAHDKKTSAIEIDFCTHKCPLPSCKGYCQALKDYLKEARRIKKEVHND